MLSQSKIDELYDKIEDLITEYIPEEIITVNVNGNEISPEFYGTQVEFEHTMMPNVQYRDKCRLLWLMALMSCKEIIINNELKKEWENYEVDSLNNINDFVFSEVQFV
jgi:hypothetical protein